MIKCAICSQIFDTQRKLHSHISRVEKLSLPDYYHTHFPRKDPLTNELIEFINFEKYFSSFFASKENLNYWFKNNWQSSEARELAKEMLVSRFDSRDLTFAPSQVELRTLCMPSIIGIQKMFDYNSFCSERGLKPRFEYGIKELSPSKKLSILIDTREHYPFKFNNSKVKKLDVGDYTVDGEDYKGVFIERKSIADFFGTLYSPKNVERFNREVNRAAEMGLYLIVVVEDTLNNCLEYTNPLIRGTNLVTHTFHNVRELMRKFDNIQFAFSYNRNSAQNLILRILSQEDPKKFDWQYLIETKQI